MTLLADSPLDPSHLVTVGQILRVHGLHGGVRVQVLSDVPHRFDVGQVLYTDGSPLHIASSATTGSGDVFLTFQGVDSDDVARSLVGQHLSVPEASVPPAEEGEYFHFQLLGLRVLTEEGEELGRLKEVLETGSNDVYVVSGDAGELLIPALRDVILQVQLDQGVMVVCLPPGLR